MKITKIKSELKGVPNYYDIHVRWLLDFEKTGNNRSKMLAMHYARVAEEMGQATIEEDTTLEFDLIRHTKDEKG